MAWRMLLLQAARLAFSLAEANAGSSIAARIAMIAITTSSSMSVKASLLLVVDSRFEPETMMNLVVLQSSRYERVQAKRMTNTAQVNG